MGNKIKAKEPIKLRFKELSNGNKSLYLDYSVNGRREYEFLKLYLIAEVSRESKEANAKTMRVANAVKAQRTVEMQNAAHGFSSSAVRSKVNLSEYVKHIAEQKRDVLNTYNGYMALLYHLGQYRGDQISFKQVDKEFCEGFVNYLKTAKSTMHNRILKTSSQLVYMKRFESVLNAAITKDIIEVNPFKKIRREDKPQRSDSVVVYLTVAEVSRLTDTPNPHPSVKSAFLFSCYCGLRYSDIRGLTWDNLKKDNAGNTFIEFVQKKTKKQEYLPIGKKALQFLPEQAGAKDTDAVFDLPTNGYVNLNLRMWAAAAGVSKHISFHVSRHTFATLLLEKTSIEVVSKALGHSDIKTTQIYAKVVDKSLWEAMNKLDE